VIFINEILKYNILNKMSEGKDLQKEKVKTKLEEFYRYPHKKEPKL